ncbi:MAG TPA: glycosyltransferase family 4 protein [Candidatus Limnocylindrales bacterium]|nr:glycosyltransferase family 4 protein [Candidatus Limnocylindrales bacterium]
MRIVWAAAYGGRQRGGFVPAMERLARRLIGEGHAFELVVPDVGQTPWHASARELGVRLHVVPNTPRAAARAVAELRGDLVHAHFFEWLAPVTLAVWRSRARVLWHLHSAFEQGTARDARITPLRRLKYGLIGARVERFICVSSAIAGDARAVGAAASKIVVVPNAVDTERFRPPSAEERTEARARLGIGGGPAIAFFGRDPRIKGADVLASALARLDAVTVVAVATPAEARAELARHARVVDVPFSEDVREVLWAVDALALPSRGEGMPFVALEAAACGIPVVASDLPWAADLARRDARVTLARSEDPGALADALRGAFASGAAPPAARDADGDGLDRWAARIAELYGLGRAGEGAPVTERVVRE